VTRVVTVLHLTRFDRLHSDCNFTERTSTSNDQHVLDAKLLREPKETISIIIFKHEE